MKSKIRIKVTEFAKTDLHYIKLKDPDSYERLLVRIEELGLDPYPDTEECTSQIIQNLKRYNIRRLKCIDVQEYRVFYQYISGQVIVYCVVKRDEKTYKEESPCYQRIKLSQKYLQRRPK
jgi:mRNA-degrading endonuclease RelE of RelBE toxin-antitoxin system